MMKNKSVPFNLAQYYMLENTGQMNPNIWTVQKGQREQETRRESVS